MRVTLLLAVALALAGRPASAHPAPFSFLDLRLVDARVEGSLVVHDFDVAHELGLASPEEVRGALASAAPRERLVRLLASRLRIRLDGVPAVPAWSGLEHLPDRQSVRLLFRLPAAAKPGATRVDAALFPYDPVHQTFVNVYEDGALRQQAILTAGRTSLTYYAGTVQGRSAVVRAFVPAGAEHILIGPDHLLFLVALLLLGGSLAKLAAIVTAFTIGHSITLSLAALGLVSPPASLVEPVIALSIVFVGADNLLVRGDDGRGRDIRPYVAGAFGLVHGFGFASVLRELGLPQAALGWSLLSFNVGVEVGQLAVVLLVAAALREIRRRSAALGDRLALTGSVLVMVAGGYWFVERVFLTGGGAS